MTFANEADLVLERGMDLTAFCMVDNFAHGVSSQELSMEGFQGLVGENQATVNRFLAELVDYLGGCA
jgi:purine nucleoside phosphorylase